MKVSKQKVAEHREQIITAAARRFRENGFDGISVADLMKEVGLTHGGFYGHFSSKEELIRLASQRALRETAQRWEKVMEESPDNPFEAFAKYYLSHRHQSHPETGCPLAALGSDIARQPRSVKEAVTEEQQAIIDLLSRFAPGRTKSLRRKQAISFLARLVGGMILARSAPDGVFSEEILNTVSASVVESVREDAN